MQYGFRCKGIATFGFRQLIREEKEVVPEGRREWRGGGREGERRGYGEKERRRCFNRLERYFGVCAGNHLFRFYCSVFLIGYVFL